MFSMALPLSMWWARHDILSDPSSGLLLFHTLWAKDFHCSAIFIAKYTVSAFAFAFKLLPVEVTSDLGLVRRKGKGVEGILGRENLKCKGFDLT